MIYKILRHFSYTYLQKQEQKITVESEVAITSYNTGYENNQQQFNVCSEIQIFNTTTDPKSSESGDTV